MTAQQLRDKFEEDLKTLQITCPHIEAEWLEHHFAPGHFSGVMVNVCRCCEKILEDKKITVGEKAVMDWEAKNEFKKSFKKKELTFEEDQ